MTVHALDSYKFLTHLQKRQLSSWGEEHVSCNIMLKIKYKNQEWDEDGKKICNVNCQSLLTSVGILYLGNFNSIYTESIPLWKELWVQVRIWASS